MSGDADLIFVDRRRAGRSRCHDVPNPKHAMTSSAGWTRCFEYSLYLLPIV